MGFGFSFAGRPLEGFLTIVPMVISISVNDSGSLDVYISDFYAAVVILIAESSADTPAAIIAEAKARI